MLHTPLGRDVLLAERAQIDEAIGPDDGPAGAGFRIELQALAADTHIELKTLIGQPVLLELLTSASRTGLRPFHGHVTEAALLGSDGGLARYRLEIEPWLAFLAHRQDAWVFQDKTVVQIVEAVFADHANAGKLVPAWRWDLADAGVYPQSAACAIQYQESDLDFVARRTLPAKFPGTECVGISMTGSSDKVGLVCRSSSKAFAADMGITAYDTLPAAARPQERPATGLIVGTPMTQYDMRSFAPAKASIAAAEVDCDTESGPVYRATATCHVAVSPLDRPMAVYGNFVLKHHTGDKSGISRDQIREIWARLDGR